MVSSVADSGPGTLRQAILDANAQSGFDSIAFNIVTVGTPTINLASALPNITDPLSINGATQPSSGLVDINGGGGAFDGLTITAGASTVRGLLLRGFSGHGLVISGGGGNTIVGDSFGLDSFLAKRPNTLENILIDNSASNTIGGAALLDRNILVSSGSYGITIQGAASTGNIVQGNLIGVAFTLFGLSLGAGPFPNAAGGVNIDGASNNIIGGAAGNTISGNLSANVIIQNGATANIVQGNLIGTNLAGDAALDSSSSVTGILISNAVGNTVGGVSAAAKNVISGNGQAGIAIVGNSNGNSVLGNFIGTNAIGTAAVPNRGPGVAVAGLGNFIGGIAPGSQNVISGNAGDGIRIDGTGLSAAPSGNQIRGNLIGLSASGTAALANSGAGIGIVNAVANVIGGSARAARNIISGNGEEGIAIAGEATSLNTIQGNFIGLSPNGLSGIGNGLAGIGIHGAASNAIGGAAASEGNTIAGNGGGGIVLDRSTTGQPAMLNVIKGNTLGTASVPNLLSAITIDGAHDNIIGGVAAGEANILRADSFAIVSADAMCNAFFANTVDVPSGVAAVQNSAAAPALTVSAIAQQGGGAEIQGSINANADSTVTLSLYRVTTVAGRSTYQTISVTDFLLDSTGAATFDPQAAGPFDPAIDRISAALTTRDNCPPNPGGDPLGDTSAFSTPTAIAPVGALANLINGQIVVTGTSGNDAITIADDGVNYVITSGPAAIQTFKKTDVPSGIVVNAGDGNDTINLAAGIRDAQINGEGGNDLISVFDPTNGSSVIPPPVDIGFGIPQPFLAGGAGNDTYSFSSAFSVVLIDEQPNEGNDTIDFSNYPNALVFNVTGKISDGPNYISESAGVENLLGGLANDRFIFPRGKVLGGRIDGGQGVNLLDYSPYTTRVSVNLSNGTGTGVSSLAHIDNVTGGSNNDVITGDARNNTLTGSGGNDKINGGAGNDSIQGSDGNDTVDGQTGNDLIHGGIGTDDLNGSAGNDSIFGDDGNDRLSGGDGNDTLTGGKGIDFMSGDNGDDLLFGKDSTVETLQGGAGKDKAQRDRNDILKTIEQVLN